MDVSVTEKGKLPEAVKTDCALDLSSRLLSLSQDDLHSIGMDV